MLMTGLAMAAAVSAQAEPELKVSPAGRILVDATYVNTRHGDDKLNSGVGIPDARMGVSFTYGQWKGRVEMGFAYNKVSMKDVWMQYELDKTNFVRGGIATPDPGNMELCLQYNYTSLSDATAGVYGGYLNDWSLCYNFYLNRRMIWRVRGSWTKVTNRVGFPDNECSILETRLQVKF